MSPRELEVVSAIGRLGSLGRAARLLGISTAAVSKRLSQLEARLGTRLFDRTTRRVSPTAEGQDLIAHGGRLLAELEDLDTRLVRTADGAAGHFRVLSTLGFGREVVAPILSSFAREHPNVTIDLTLSQGFSEEYKAFDMAVTIGQIPTKSFETTCVIQNRRVLVASRKYLQRHGTPKAPADLRKHRCLVMMETGGDPTIWPLAGERVVEPVRITPHLSSNDGAVVVGWALDGHGIALRSEWTVGRQVKLGRLVQVLRHYWVPADVLLVWPRSRYVPARITMLGDYVSKRIRSAFAQGRAV